MDKERVKLKIEGMMCSMCAKHVERALSEVPGVSDVRVDLEKGFAELTMKEGEDPAPLVSAVSEAGYSVVEVSK